MSTRDNYEEALNKRRRLFSKIKGGMTESTQKQLDAATTEVIKYRNKLIETGEWEGAVPIPVKAKYRR